MPITLNQFIRTCVTVNGDPTSEMIHNYCKTYGFFDEDIKKELKAMVERSELRMKDDDIDHDWSYREGRNW
jgi:hypothetical protein